MEVRTHLRANPSLCGHIVELGEERATVALETSDIMAVDAHGLVHGGFVFGLADYAAMLAVNDPNVVLGAAETKFIEPVRLGDRVVADARTEVTDGRKRRVRVEAKVGAKVVFIGTFDCFVLEHHVLGGVGSK